MRVGVIGCGNPDGGDDAVGRHAARRLAIEGVETVEVRGDAGAILEALEGCDAAILVDAVRSGAAPGTVHRWAGDELAAAGSSTSTHGFGLREALGLARALDRLPAEVVVYGVEHGGRSAGTALSEPVGAALATVCARIREERERLRCTNVR